SGLTVLAKEVLVVQFAHERLRLGVNYQGVIRHARYIFQSHGIMGSFARTRSPAERSMSSHQHGRNPIRIEAAKTFTNRNSGFALVLASDLRRTQPSGDRHLTVKVVGMVSPKARNRLLRLF